MADFHQNGVISTLHKLGDRPVEELEERLIEYAKERPMTLVLPSLFSELQGDALKNIVEELKSVPYLNNIVIGLDRATEDEFKYAKDFFSALPQKHAILWNDGPRLRAIDAQLEANNLSAGPPGKGRNVWYCFGYVLAGCPETEIVGLHDCDITTYDRSMLARLMYPLANPHFNYMFSKGYYARIANDSMNGRVTRLLITPLIHALRQVYGYDPYLNYLNSFRYPLAGEFAMNVSMLSDLRIPSDWGLEVGILSEIRRHYSTKVICQVDIADAYDHKHQDVSENDKTKGLSKMSIDIALSIFRKLAIAGNVVSEERIRTVKATYLRCALDLVEVYKHDAVINGLKYDVHKEENTVELFASNIVQAGAHFIDEHEETPFVPRWNRVRYAIPDIMEQIKTAVEEDNA
ncbi:MAG: glycosyl transferase [Alphaproteobacteria bacterium]|nr:glycosyl transferase [Alphaproteobacteria bacterium]|tara:strand:- start:40034 stop:41248 length:1215 start_codon:yes stop_codon:yes gene_type:complete